MKRHLNFTYSFVGYVLSIFTLTLLILWVYPWPFMPINIDLGDFNNITTSVIIDISLLLLFGLQHSLMARTFFKDKVLGRLSIATKSATYSVSSSLCLLLIFYFWQPIEGSVWDLQSDIGFWTMTIIYLVGWIVAFISTFAIDHFELFGLHQGYRALKNLPEPEVVFQKKWLYKYVRHPIQAGTLVGLWATPSMGYSHLILSFGMTLYVFIGLYLEEKNLVKTFGSEYEAYKNDVPMLIPFSNNIRA
ncbi:MAG: NnrU family protein [Sulfurimonadaceae bacterium]